MMIMMAIIIIIIIIIIMKNNPSFCFCSLYSLLICYVISYEASVQSQGNHKSSCDRSADRR